MENNTCSLLNSLNLGYSCFMRMMMIFILLVSMSCGRESPTQKSEKISNAINSKQVNSLLEKKKFELKIYFESNAKPEFGNFHDSSLSYWNLAQTNIERLLLNHYKTPNIFIPQKEEEVTSLPSFEIDEWDNNNADQIIKPLIAQTEKDSQTAYLHVFFVTGKWKKEKIEEGVKVLGVSMVTSNYILIFKDSMMDFSKDQNMLAFIEQRSMIHEIAHSLGLVNRGIKMQRYHEDPDHEHHCSNPKCLLYWMNDAVASYTYFLAHPIDIFFGEECLSDIDHF